MRGDGAAPRSGASAGVADQAGAAFRFEWGRAGLDALAPHCDVVIVVDVLRFGTAVSVAVEAGATVLPAGASTPAGGGSDPLSPAAIRDGRCSGQLLAPSPNGAALSLRADELDVPFVLAGCLRNASATARRALALAHEGAIAVIAAGERWGGAEGSLRPCLEDLIGAGAVLHALDPAGAIRPPLGSAEARAARAAYLDARPMIADVLANTASGRELDERGLTGDISLAAEVDATALAAQLVDGAFVGA